MVMQFKHWPTYQHN